MHSLKSSSKRETTTYTLLHLIISLNVSNLLCVTMQFVPDPRFEEVKEYARSGVFGPYNYDELIGSLEGIEGFGRADYFLVGKDFPSYIECQEKVDEAYQDQKVSFTFPLNPPSNH